MFYLTSASDVAMGVIKLNRIKANDQVCASYSQWHTTI